MSVVAVVVQLDKVHLKGGGGEAVVGERNFQLAVCLVVGQVEGLSADVLHLVPAQIDLLNGVQLVEGIGLDCLDAVVS